MPISHSLLGRARRYLADAARAFERAPVEVVLAVVVALTTSWAIEAGNDHFRTWLRVATSPVVAIAGAWSATLLHAFGRVSAPRRWGITILSLLLAALLGVFALQFEHRAEDWRALLLIGAACAWLLAVPALAAAPEQRNLMLRRVTGRILVRALGAGLYAGALFAGLALALGAIDTLFELDLHEEIYAHVFAWLMIVLVPWVTFGGVPDYARPLEEVNAVSTVVHRLTGFLVPPLLALYYLILFAYAIRIGVVGELPKNLVSPMVIAAGVLGATAILLFDPEPKDPAGRGALRLAPPLFLPLAVLGFWSIWPRIEQYGFTEFRAARFNVLVVLSALALAGTVLVLRKRRFLLFYIPLATAIMLAISAIGPLSVLAVARRSQRTQLAEALAAAGLRTGASPAVPAGSARTVPADIYRQVNSSVLYLTSHFGDAALEGLIAAEGRTKDAQANLSAYLGLVPAQQPGQKSPFAASLAPGTATLLNAEQTAYRVLYPFPSSDTSIVIRQDSISLVITASGRTVSANLSQMISELALKHPESALLPELAAVPLLDSAGTRAGTLIVFSINGESEPGRFNVSHLDGLVLFDRVVR